VGLTPNFLGKGEGGREISESIPCQESRTDKGQDGKQRSWNTSRSLQETYPVSLMASLRTQK